jgi:hypothetical protein
MTDIKDRIILDLCGGTGAWSKPYKDNGYDVRNITLPDYDVRTYMPPKNVYGILAAPPCTMFSLARTKANKPRDLEEGFEIVRACLNIIWSCMEIQQDTKKKTLPLKFWVLENPNGMLKFFLGKPVFEFNPYEFGDGYKKRTMLWGWFNEPKKKIGKIIVEAPYHSLNPKIMKKFDQLASREIAPEMFGKLTRQERRAITPSGFAKAFYEENK